MHPDVELVRVASVDHVGEPLGAAHPNLTGRNRPALRGPPARRGRAGLRRRAARPAAQGHRAKVPELIALGREDRRHVGRLPAARRRRLRAVLRREAPAPRAARQFVYGLPELNRERDPDGARTSRRPAASRPTIELALLPLARAGLLSGAVVHVVGITGSSGSGVAPPRRHAPPGARGQPQDRTSRSSTSTCRRSLRRWRDAGAQGVELRSCRCRRRCRAASSPPASSSCRRT